MDITPPEKSPEAWHLYLLECRNGSLYAGIAKDVQARFCAHVGGKGAKYTRANKPLRIVGSLAYPDRSAASKAEWAIKQMRPAKKLEFIGRERNCAS